MTAPARLALIAQKNSKSLSIQRKRECLGLHCVWPWIEGSRGYCLPMLKVWCTKHAGQANCPQIAVSPLFSCVATSTWTETTLVTWGTPRPGAPRGRLAACRAFGLGCRSQSGSSCRWRSEFGDLAWEGPEWLQLICKTQCITSHVDIVAYDHMTSELLKQSFSSWFRTYITKVSAWVQVGILRHFPAIRQGAHRHHALHSCSSRIWACISNTRPLMQWA